MHECSILLLLGWLRRKRHPNRLPVVHVSLNRSVSKRVVGLVQQIVYLQLGSATEHRLGLLVACGSNPIDRHSTYQAVVVEVLESPIVAV